MVGESISKNFNYHKWLQVQGEINKRKISIEREVFTKSSLEKKKLKEEKKSYKLHQGVASYEKERDSLIGTLINSKYPKFNLSVINGIKL